jgi:small subunit ribosomal protein S14
MKNRWQKKDRQRRKTVDTFNEQRVILKASLRDASGLNDQRRMRERTNSILALPRDSSPTRVHNRCVEDGSARSIIRKYRRSRFTIRNMAMNGQLPGLIKASW